MKTNKIIKKALKHPELFSQEELLYFHLVKRERKRVKQLKKAGKLAQE